MILATDSISGLLKRLARADDAEFLRLVRSLPDATLLAVCQRCSNRTTLQRLYESCCIHDDCNCLTKGMICPKCGKKGHHTSCSACGTVLHCHHETLRPLRPSSEDDPSDDLTVDINTAILSKLFPERRGDRGYADRRPDTTVGATISQRGQADVMRRRNERKVGVRHNRDAVHYVNSLDKENRILFMVKWLRKKNGRAVQGTVQEMDDQ